MLVNTEHTENALSPIDFMLFDNNIVCTDTFKWDYENWCPIKESKCEALF